MKTLKETVVRYDTAKLAVSLGFEDTIGVFKGKSYYNQEGELNGDVTYELKNKESKSIPAPTQSLLIRVLEKDYDRVTHDNYGGAYIDKQSILNVADKMKLLL